MGKILIACEESQAVMKEFRNLGYEAYSCDLLPCSGGFPEYHLQQDVVPLLKEKWDLVIAFPTCTYLTISANKWYADQPKRKSGTLVGEERRKAREEAIGFFMKFTKLKCPWAIENPIGIMSTVYKKPSQVVQPWMFGHPEQKATCLWLNNLPLLEETNNVKEEMMKLSNSERQRLHHLPPSKDRAKLRSKTFGGVAKAMATQWSKYLLDNSGILMV